MCAQVYLKYIMDVTAYLEWDWLAQLFTKNFLLNNKNNNAYYSYFNLPLKLGKNHFQFLPIKQCSKEINT